MVSNKSLDEYELIAALLHDASKAHGLVFNTRACSLTTKVVERRVRKEGLGFLTKTLPKLGKALEKALAENEPLNATKLGFAAMHGTELPRFLGEFFSLILKPDGNVRPDSEAKHVKVVLELLYCFYKYEVPYTDEQEQQVISRFEKTEEDLSTRHPFFQKMEEDLRDCTILGRRQPYGPFTTQGIVREARILLQNVFSTFDPLDIRPRHGPGAVATKQQLAEKWQWSNVSNRITDYYPLDAYFYANLSHVGDRLDTLQGITQQDLPARVILVPKDSRGPRLISCEPVDFQWIQQGLGRAIVELVEGHRLTRDNVRFTDQTPNRFAALCGSLAGKYSTLDLNEASDRVSVDLVRLLYPEHIFVYLNACRSSSTELPDGSILNLNKFAPMGSCLCFPIMALTVWAILTAAAPDADTRESIYVYGDDVIVPTKFAGSAIEHLESFGLKINRDKSCTGGLFRESCGMYAFKGDDVTPVRFRTVWSSTPSPEVYTSWISYANSLWDRQYYSAYYYIVKHLTRVYGHVPSEDMHLACPSLRRVPADARPNAKRWNRHLQRWQYRVYDIKSPTKHIEIDGWLMLHRYFTECPSSLTSYSQVGTQQGKRLPFEGVDAFAVCQYTKRRTSMLVRRWR